MYKLVAPFLLPVIFIGFIIQTIRIDGFPLFYTGVRQQLADCQLVNSRANEEAQKAADKAREEGRISAAADSMRLIEEERQRRVATDKTIVDLRNLVARLRPVSPPPVVIPGQPEPPVVVTPPALPAVCRLDQGALEAIRGTLNSQRQQ